MIPDFPKVISSPRSLKPEILSTTHKSHMERLRNGQRDRQVIWLELPGKVRERWGLQLLKGNLSLRWKNDVVPKVWIPESLKHERCYTHWNGRPWIFYQKVFKLKYTAFCLGDYISIFSIFIFLNQNLGKIRNNI